MNLIFYNPETIADLSEVKWSALQLAILQENYRMQRRDLSRILSIAPGVITAKMRELGLVKKDLRPPARYRKHRRKESKLHVAKPEKENTELRRKKTRKEASRLEAEMMARRKKRAEAEAPKYETRQFDYTRMITVRIDKRTVIQIPAGEDPEKAREKFFRTNKAYAERKAMIS